MQSVSKLACYALIEVQQQQKTVSLSKTHVVPILMHWMRIAATF
jgi:hypothetical protein